MSKKTNDENRPEQPKSGKGWKVFLALILAIAVIVGVALAIAFGGHRRSADPPKESSSSSQQTDADGSIEIGDSKSYQASGSGGTLSSVQIAEKCKPSVIAILVYGGNGKSSYGEGSGVVMSVNKAKNTSTIITCAHIINTANTTCKVQLENGKTYDAKVVGYDNRTDIGVITVGTADLTPAEFGDSSVLKVGEPVYAIGNPGGTQFYGSFTSGVISAIDRPTASGQSGYTMECIQHDAAINPGNSGGALINSYGQVIGINSSKIASEEYEGMGFAVPIKVAKKVVDDILANGYVQNRAKLGITYVPASQNSTYQVIAKSNKLPDGAVVIESIASDSALNGTKAKRGDIILAVNGKDLKTPTQLTKVIEDSHPGDKIRLTIGTVGDDYKVSKYEVTVALIEDRGNTQQPQESESSSRYSYSDPFSRYFGGN